MWSWTLATAIVCLLMMLLGSLFVRGQVPATARLPMQWGLDGKPTWYAPRDVAIAFGPLLAFAVLVVMLLANHVSRGRLSWAIPVAAGVFLVTHVVWLYLAWRHPGPT